MAAVVKGVLLGEGAAGTAGGEGGRDGLVATLGVTGSGKVSSYGKNNILKLRRKG